MRMVKSLLLTQEDPVSVYRYNRKVIRTTSCYGCILFQKRLLQTAVESSIGAMGEHVTDETTSYSSRVRTLIDLRDALSGYLARTRSGA